MKKIFLLFLISTLCFSEDLKIKKIVRVYDGDTFYANLKNVHPLLADTIGIRISGIDTPELRGSSDCIKKMGYIARDFVKNKLENAKKIELKNYKRGKYFRIIADVYIDGENISNLLINNGYAKKYDGGKKPEWKCEN